jgi:hypothetical protein
MASIKGKGIIMKDIYKATRDYLDNATHIYTKGERGLFKEVLSSKAKSGIIEIAKILQHEILIDHIAILDQTLHNSLHDLGPKG